MFWNKNCFKISLNLKICKMTLLPLPRSLGCYRYYIGLDYIGIITCLVDNDDWY